MINDKNQKQEAGDDSTNLQATTIVVNQGISYQDARDIALDVFRANFLELSQKAGDTARKRAEELVDDFLSKLKDTNPESIESMEDPGMLNALFTAQKEYAKTGDKDLSDMLVDILVDRAGKKERNLEQIVLDESLSVIPKLTSSQFDTLSLIFLIKYSINESILNISSLKRHLEKNISPFISFLSKEESLYQHLEYTGCASNYSEALLLEGIFYTNYYGLFFKGFTKKDFEFHVCSIDKYDNLVIPCLHDLSKLQLNILNDTELNLRVEDLKIDPETENRILDIKSKYRMSPSEIANFLKKQNVFMPTLFEIWNKSKMKNMLLTTVGIAIASANCRRKIGIQPKLSDWIK